jgi:hypothetical protein
VTPAKRKKSAKKKTATGNWTQHFEIYFRGKPSPWEVKYEIEKTLGILLARDTGHTDKLVFIGSSPPPDAGHNIQLRFEAAFPEEGWYSLLDDAWVPRSWFSQDEFLTDAKRTFEYWTRNLQTSSNIDSLQNAPQKLYADRVHETLAIEFEEANRKTDEGPIQLVQQAVLAALRKGKRLGSSHHEGGTRLFFNGSKFVKEIYGVEESFTEFGTDDEMIACLRAFYDWDSRQDSYPHRPPELEVWKYIQRQLW